MYARLCKRLAEEAPNFEPVESPCTFRTLLLNKCKDEFENRAAALDQSRMEVPVADDDDERRQLAKRKMLGNIKFIGELGKLDILSESILHRCIQELIHLRRGDDPSEDFECLSQIMRTCGRILDTDKGKGLMDQYFHRLSKYAENQDLQPRIRFMLKDVIDLRTDGWVPRKATVVEGPMPIHQIRPADDDRTMSAYRTRERNHDRDTDRSNVTELFRHPMKTRSGFDDLLTGLTLAPTTPTFIPSGPYGPNNGFSGGGNQRDGGGGYRNQRSGGGGGGYYNNQRGQYKHNQNNTNLQYSQSNKDLAPRFKKNLILSKEQIQDVELRPNSMLFNKASTVKANNLMNTRNLEPAFTTTTQSPKQQPTPLHKEPLPIKQASSEKPKQSKKDKGPNKEEVLKKVASLLDDYWKGDIDLKQAVNSYREHKVPEKFAKDVILHGLTLAIDKLDVEQEKLVKLLSNLKEQSAVSGNTVQESFKSFCTVLNERENEIAKATNSVAVILAAALTEHLISLSEVASLTDNGAYYPLFLLILQNLQRKWGKTELTEVFNKSKINLLTQLPESNKTKENLSEVLEERDLTFLYPLLRIQAELSKQLQADSNPQTFYKWIRENLDTTSFSDPGFINALMTVLLKYITQEAAATANNDEKLLIEKEKSMLELYQPILRAFLREKHSLQLVALYSLQVHFFSLGFPQKQLLRWFMNLYDLEIVDEEAFLTWKEDVTDAYPGKGQALFQVNQWLTWLQTASEEEEEGDD